MSYLALKLDEVREQLAEVCAERDAAHEDLRAERLRNVDLERTIDHLRARLEAAREPCNTCPMLPQEDSP